jgi:hypothetical protein
MVRTLKAFLTVLLYTVLGTTNPMNLAFKRETVDQYKLSIIFGKFIHTQNGDDILQTLVILEKLLGCMGSFVVVLHSNDTGGSSI